MSALRLGVNKLLGRINRELMGSPYYKGFQEIALELDALVEDTERCERDRLAAQRASLPPTTESPGRLTRWPD